MTSPAAGDGKIVHLFCSVFFSLITSHTEFSPGAILVHSGIRATKHLSVLDSGETFIALQTYIVHLLAWRNFSALETRTGIYFILFTFGILKTQILAKNTFGILKTQILTKNTFRILKTQILAKKYFGGLKIPS